MFARAIRIFAIASLAGGVTVAFAGAAAGAPGPGTWTKITTPSGTTTFKFPGNHHLTVSGVTSNDVTSVDIDCIYNSVSGPSSQSLATSVPVSTGAFSTVATISNLLPNCRLRAVPTGVDPAADYLGSYAGPIMYMNGIKYNTVGSTRTGYQALDETGDGLVAMVDAAECGPALAATITPPAMLLSGSGSEVCAFALPSANITQSGTSTASAIKVNGHSAYLPYGVETLLNGTQALGLPQPALTVNFTRFNSGHVRVTESAPLKRCSVDDTYPPTSTSCPSLVNTGVTFKRVSDLFRGAHQIRVRDTFASSDNHAHTINVQYQGQFTSPPDTGRVGYDFPGGSTTFHKSSHDQTVTGLGTKAGTTFIRSDMFSVEGDPLADTLGLTWSRAPQKVYFSPNTDEFFAMPYSLSAPAGGAAHLGFAYSEHVKTADTKKLAGVAVNEMVNVPHIGSPSNGALITGHTTTVKGYVTLGANGLPTKVLVNGHAAHLTKVSATKETYSVSFTESFGKHTIKVTAKDVAGNAKSKSITVKNVAT
jgi:hypothetical protein